MNNGPVDILLYQTRDGAFRARVTMTSPEAQIEPYSVPQQMTSTTKPSVTMFGAMVLAADLVKSMKGFI